eukprot:12932491-Prorocentrum_lima.AAC.1
MSECKTAHLENFSAHVIGSTEKEWQAFLWQTATFPSCFRVFVSWSVARGGEFNAAPADELVSCSYFKG